MSSIRPGDRPLHYEDGSHRWSGGPPGKEQDAWRAKVEAHMAAHQAEMRKPRSARPMRSIRRVGVVA